MKTLLSAVLLVAAAHNAAAQCILSYDAPRATAVPATAPVLAVDDMNGDGAPDALVRNGIYFSFRTLVPLPLNEAAGEVALLISDANRDGRLDVLAASDTQLITLLGNGDGTFTRKSTAAAVTPATLLFADFTGDGVLDAFAPGVQVHLANGDGTYTAETGMAFTGNARWAAADVNGDGRDDLIAASPNPGQVIVYRREASGFAAGQLGPFVNGRPAAIADFDRDGRDDVFFVPESQFFTTALYFNLSGIATRENTAFDFGTYVAADVNGDGAPDLLGGSGYPEVTTRVYLNDGKGNLRVSAAVTGFEAMPIAADADGDDIPDLVGMKAGDVFIVHGNGDGSFRLPRTSVGPSLSAVSGDFDGDGDDDVATLTAIAWNNGDNTFRVVPASSFSRIFRAVDVDGDGKAEIVAQNGAALEVVHADAPLAPLARIEVPATDAAVGDFTGQHRMEIAALVGAEVRVFELRTGASPRFVAAVSGGLPRSIEASDLNGDGASDIVVAGGTILEACCHAFFPTGRDGFVSTFVSTGTSFGPERRASYASAAFDDLALGDFDGDNKVDAAVSTHLQGRSVVVWYGDGTGAFARSQEIVIPSSDGLYHLDADDLNGDRITDLAVNGAQRVFAGSRTGLQEVGRYFGPLVSATLTLRARRGALPSILGVPRTAPNALLYRPFCPRERAVRH